ncbi:Cw1 [Schizosaccharomyces pombe]
MAFSEVFLFNILVGSPRVALRHISGERWGLKCSLADHIIFAILSILVFIVETVEPGSSKINIMERLRGDNARDATQHVNEYTAISLREMNPESEA